MSSLMASMVFENIYYCCMLLPITVKYEKKHTFDRKSQSVQEFSFMIL